MEAKAGALCNQGGLEKSIADKDTQTEPQIHTQTFTQTETQTFTQTETQTDTPPPPPETSAVDELTWLVKELETQLQIKEADMLVLQGEIKLQSVCMYVCIAPSKVIAS